MNNEKNFFKKLDEIHAKIEKNKRRKELCHKILDKYTRELAECEKEENALNKSYTSKVMSAYEDFKIVEEAAKRFCEEYGINYELVVGVGGDANEQSP